MQGNDAIKNATSILDYVFRELAISYLGRNDLAHVEPADIGHDVLGKGDEQSRAPQPGQPSTTAKFVSRGFVRSKTDKLMLVQSFAPAEPAKTPTVAAVSVGATAPEERRPRGPLRAEPARHPDLDAPGQTARRSPRPPRRSPHERLYRRSLPRMREFYAGAERDVFEVRYVWRHDGV